MRTSTILLSVLLAAAPGAAQEPSPAAMEKASEALGWRFGVAAPRAQSLSELLSAASRLGVRRVEGHPGLRTGEAGKPLAPSSLNEAELAAALKQMDAAGVSMPVYRLPRLQAPDAALFEFARKLGIEVIVTEVDPSALDAVERYAERYGVSVAIRADNPQQALAACRSRGKRIGVAADLAVWLLAGTRPVEAIQSLKDRVLAARLYDADGFGAQRRPVPLGQGVAGIAALLQEAYKLELTPALWSIAADDAEAALHVRNYYAAIAPIVQYHQSYASRTRGMRRLASVNAEERAKIEQALPAAAPARPNKPRKVLVIDLNAGRVGGHPSIPYANLAMELMGKRTGAFTATISNDPALLAPERLREFDAVFLNNTQGDVFDTAQAREAFLNFIRSGGGLVANHAVTVTNTGWEEFGFLLGARGAMHRESDEKVTIQLDDPASPLNAPFAGKNLTFSDEFFRFTHPYSRARVRVLQSFDVARTDMNQGRSYGAVTRLDGDYPVSWVRSEGKGRVLYTTFGHGPSAFWNPQVLAFFLAAMQFACGDLEANTAPDLDAAARSFENLLSAVPAYDFGKERKALEEAGRVVTDSVTVPAWRARVERSLLAMLARPGLSLGAKDFLCRQLSVAGSAASVPALAAMLRQPETVEMARYAMERIPGSEADKALRDALASGAKAGRIGIINSIGMRADAQAVALLASLVKAEDAGVGAAAAHAVGRIATPAACRAVDQAAPAAPELRRAVLSARLDCAAKTVATNRAGAAKSYAALLSNSAEPSVRVAALRGLAATAPAEAAKEAAGALGRDDAALRAAAVQLLAAQEPKTLLDRFDTLPAPAQVQAITAFATRGWKPAAPAVTRSVSSGAPEVQLAAVRALPLVGDQDAVPVLARIAAESEGAVQEAARDGLARMPGESLDAAVVAGIGSGAGSMKVELIRAAGARASASAAPVLLAAARDSDAAIRREAMRSLRTAAAPGDTRALIALVVSAPNATDRREAEQALVASLRRWEKPPVSELINAYRGDASPDARASLLMAMALTGAPEGLPVLREALAANDAALRRAAILALTEWPNADPAADLLAVARQGGATSHAVLALRGYVKLIGLPSSRPRPETARLAGEALRAASRAEEKKLALAVLAQAPCAESLAMAEAAAADPAVAAEARQAAETIRKVMNSERR